MNNQVQTIHYLGLNIGLIVDHLTQHWFNSRSLQNAPQETEIESYVIGGVKQDVKKDQFKTFKL